MVPSDSARRIGASTLLNEVLTVGEGLWGRCFKKCDIERFRLWCKNRWRYGEMDGAIRFSASNRCIYALERSSDSRGRALKMEVLKIAKWDTFSTISLEPGPVRPNGQRH